MQENVAIVKRVYERVAKREWGEPDVFSPDVVYRPIATFTETRECHGIEQYRRFLESFMEAWAEDFVLRPVSFRAVGNAVIARVEFDGHARTSGIAIAERIYNVFWLQDGRITRAEDFISRADALKAVGLQESD
ncbi:MAG TPA: nuclear transport factor 2 family protein [Solirubrobacteraceae bacterium]|jgi:ketosteroid isomerase-like protein